MNPFDYIASFAAFNPITATSAPFIRLAGQKFGGAPKASEDDTEASVSTDVPRANSSSGGRGYTANQAEMLTKAYLDSIKAEKESFAEQSGGEPPSTQGVAPGAVGSTAPPLEGSAGSDLPPSAGPLPGDIAPADINALMLKLVEKQPALLDQQQRNAIQRSIVTAALRDRGLQELSRRRITQENIAANRDMQIAQTQARSNQSIAMANILYASLQPNPNLMSALSESMKAGMQSVTVPSVGIIRTKEA